MKITVYTITDCLFSKQEKEYLTVNKLQYEEKNLETNKEFLTEMLAVSNNFAGTPVTKIEKDDGQIVVLKGFTKEEFDKASGLVVEAEVKPEEAKKEEGKQDEALNAVLQDLQAKSTDSPPVEPTTTPPPAPPTPSSTPTEPPQEPSQETPFPSVPPTPTEPSTTPPVTPPTVPDFNAKV